MENATEELIGEFRDWQRSWDNYQQQVLKNPEYYRQGNAMPISMGDFVIELGKKYTVKKRK